LHLQLLLPFALLHGSQLSLVTVSDGCGRRVGLYQLEGALELFLLGLLVD